MTPAFTVRPAPVFRGSRDYFHSTDLYEALVEGLQAHGVAATGFELKLRERIRRAPRIDFFQGEAAGHDAPAAARFETPQGAWIAQVAEEGEPITARKPYDEERIWSRVVRDGRSFTLSGCADASPIEIVTAVAVHAHRTLLPPPAGQRWLLGQLSAQRLLGPGEQSFFRLDVTRQLGPAMTQCTLAGSAGAFGRMLFILK